MTVFFEFGIQTSNKQFFIDRFTIGNRGKEDVCSREYNISFVISFSLSLSLSLFFFSLKKVINQIKTTIFILFNYFLQVLLSDGVARKIHNYII